MERNALLLTDAAFPSILTAHAASFAQVPMGCPSDEQPIGSQSDQAACVTVAGKGGNAHTLIFF